MHTTLYVSEFFHPPARIVGFSYIVNRDESLVSYSGTVRSVMFVERFGNLDGPHAAERHALPGYHSIHSDVEYCRASYIGVRARSFESRSNNAHLCVEDKAPRTRGPRHRAHQVLLMKIQNSSLKYFC